MRAPGSPELSVPVRTVRGMESLHVVAHVAVSLDGATTGFQPDLTLSGRLVWMRYRLAR
jgi:hypothetical protein